MPVLIRPAIPEDVRQLHRLAEALNLHEGEETEHLTPDAVLRDMISETRAVDTLVAEQSGALVGYVSFTETYEPPQAQRGFYIADIFVADAARSQGVGRMLMAGVAKQAKQRGLTFIGWTSRSDNGNAHAFYRKLGAIHVPVIAHAVFGDSFDTLAGEG